MTASHIHLTERRRARSLLVGVAVAAAASVGAALAPAGAAFSPETAAADCAYTTIVDWNMYTDARTYPGSPYRVSSLGCGTYASSGGGNGYYRWSDDPDHTTVIAGNDCYNGNLLGKTDIGAHNTAYHSFQGFYPAGTCFNLRGRVATGAGPFYNHDGVLAR